MKYSTAVTIVNASVTACYTHLMSWKKKKRKQGKNQYYSISRKLRRDKLITEEFEVMLNSLSLEEVIALKLELASRVVGGNLYGLPLWDTLPNIIKDAVLKYSVSATRTQTEAARFLGLNKDRLFKLVKKFDIHNFFDEKQ